MILIYRKKIHKDCTKFVLNHFKISQIKSLLVYHFDSLSVKLTRICQTLSDSLSELNDDNSLIFMKSFSFDEALFQQILSTCGSIGADDPLKSYSMLCLFIPQIKIDSNPCLEKLKGDQPSSFVERAQPSYFKKHQTRCAIASMVSWIYATFFLSLCQNLNKLTFSDFDALANIFLHNCNPFPHDSLFNQMNFHSCQIWGQAFGFLSLLSNQFSSSFAIKTFMKAEPNSILTYSILFSKIQFHFSSKDQPIQFFIMTNKILSDFNSEIEDINYISQLVVDVLGYYLVQFPEKRQEEFVKSFLVASKHWILDPKCGLSFFELYALCQAFLGAPFSEVLDTLNNLKNQIGIYKILSVFIRGPNFETSIIRPRFEVMLKQDIKKINLAPAFDLINSKEILPAFSESLKEFFITAIIFNLPFFLKNLPMIYNDNTKLSLFLALANLSQFSDLIPNYNSSLLILKEFIEPKLYEEINLLILNESDPATYSPISFTDDFNINILEYEESRNHTDIKPSTFDEHLESIPAEILIYRKNINFLPTLRLNHRFSIQTLVRWSRFFEKMKDIVFPYSIEKPQTLISYKPLDSEDDHSAKWPFLVLGLALEFCKYSGSFIDSLLKMIVNHPFETSIASLRALQVIIHIQPILGSEILEKFISIKPTNIEALHTIFTSLSCLLNTVQTMGLTIPKELLTKILITGICSSYPQIRTLAYGIIQNYETDFSPIIKNEQILISSVKDAALFAIYPVLDSSVSKLSPIPISDIISTNSNRLYLFYLSAFGSLFIDNKNMRNQIKEMIDIFSQETNLLSQFDSKFMGNFSSFFIASLNIEDMLTLQNYSKLAGRVFAFFVKTDPIDFLGFSSFVSIRCFDTWLNRIFVYVLKFFPDYAFAQELIRPITYMIYRILRRYPDYLDQISCLDDLPPGLKSAYHYLIKTFSINFFDAKNDNLKKQSLISSENQIILKELSLEFGLLFEAIASKHIRSRTCFFNFAKVNVPFNHTCMDSESFYFWITLATFPKSSSFSVDSAKAFTAWCKCGIIPDQCFQMILDNFQTIQEKDENFATVILARYHSIFLPFFIENAISNDIYFQAIANQFDQYVISEIAKDTLKFKNLRESVSEDERIDDDFYQEEIFLRAGDLLAIGCYYLQNSNSLLRKKSLSFLCSLLESCVLVSSRLDDPLAIKSSLSSLLISEESTFSQYVDTATEFCHLIIKYFPYCSEQFINRCFLFPLFATQKKTTNNSDIYKFIPMSSVLTSLDTNQIYQSFKKIELFPKKKIIEGPNSKTKQKQNNSIDLPIQDNQNSKHKIYNLELVVPWLEKFSNPSEMFSKCYPIFKKLTFFSFITSLISHDIMNHTPSCVSMIITNLANQSKSTLFSLIEIILNFAMHKSPSSTSCRAILLLILSSHKSTVLPYLFQLLSFQTWLFFFAQNYYCIFENISTAKNKDINNSDESNDSQEESLLPDENDNQQPQKSYFFHKAHSQFYRPNQSNIPKTIVGKENNTMSFCYNSKSNSTFGSLVFSNWSSKFTKLLTFLTSVLSSHGQLFPNDLIEESSRLSVLSQLLPKLEPLKKTLPSDSLSIQELRSWAFCCGDLEIANKALKILKNLHYQLDPSDKLVVIRSISILSILLFDKEDLIKINVETMRKINQYICLLLGFIPDELEINERFLSLEIKNNEQIYLVAMRNLRKAISEKSYFNVNPLNYKNNPSSTREEVLRLYLFLPFLLIPQNETLAKMTDINGDALKIHEQLKSYPSVQNDPMMFGNNNIFEVVCKHYAFIMGLPEITLNEKAIMFDLITYMVKGRLVHLLPKKLQELCFYSEKDSTLTDFSRAVIEYSAQFEDFSFSFDPFDGFNEIEKWEKLQKRKQQLKKNIVYSTNDVIELNVDDYQDILNYPPIIFIVPEFDQLPLQKHLMKLIANIKIEPISHSLESILNAQSEMISNLSDEFDTRKFFLPLNEALEQIEVAFKKKQEMISLPPIQMNINKNLTKDMVFTINTSLLAPDIEEVDSIGSSRQISIRNISYVSCF